jgi:hypothetical protein|nr:MAG TPA: hypothetical protein [Ackermannviridae sp.]DAW82272.1 MAG TPA: hypothetical protein [Bacteriophage sp.]
MSENTLKQIGCILEKETNKYLKEVYNKTNCFTDWWDYENCEFSTKRKLLIDGRIHTIICGIEDIVIYFCIRKKGKILMWGQQKGVIQPVIATEKKLTQEQFDTLKKAIIEKEQEHKLYIQDILFL